MSILRTVRLSVRGTPLPCLQWPRSKWVNLESLPFGLSSFE